MVPQRPDGTIQYAENPPKKYQDIYPFDFETDDWRGAVGRAAATSFVFWIDAGRARLPRRQPAHQAVPVLGVVHRRGASARHPEVIFLAEAFTRPKVMYRLAKLGFTQSYTYFTWRNTKYELTRVLHRADADRRCATSSGRTSGRTRPTSCPSTCSTAAAPASSRGSSWRRRSARTTASTARRSSCWSTTPREPGSEEYLRLGEVSRSALGRSSSGRTASRRDRALNRIRRENPALQPNRSLRFHHDRQRPVIAYTKTTATATNAMLVVVNLDPHHTQSAARRAPRPRRRSGIVRTTVSRYCRCTTRARRRARHIFVATATHATASDSIPGTCAGATSSRVWRRHAVRERRFRILHANDPRRPGDRPHDASVDRLTLRRSALVQRRDHLRGARPRLLRQQRRRHRRLPRADAEARLPRRTSASPRSGCCRSTRRRSRTTATTSPTTPTSTRSTARCDDFQRVPATRRTGAACGSSPSWSSTTPPTSTPGSSGRGARRRAAPSATSTSGATRPTSTRTRGSSSRTSRRSNWTWDPVAKAYYWHRFYSPPAGPQLRQPRGPRGAVRGRSTSGSTWASTGCGSTPSPTSTSARARTARTCPRRTPS